MTNTQTTRRVNPFLSIIEEPQDRDTLRAIASAIDAEIVKQLSEEGRNASQPAQYPRVDRIYFALCDLYRDAHNQEPTGTLCGYCYAKEANEGDTLCEQCARKNAQ